MNGFNHSNFIFFLAYSLLFILMGALIWPYIHAFIFAGILAGTFHSLSRYLHQQFDWKKSYAAGFVCCVIVTALFVPTLFMIQQLSEEAFDLYQHLKNNINEAALKEIFFGEGTIPTLLKKGALLLGLEYNFESLQELILDTTKNMSTLMFDTLNSLVSNVFLFLFQLIIMLVVIYSLLAEDDKFKDFIMKLSPLPDDEEELVMQKFNQMNYVTLVGNGIGGVIQGSLAIIGFWWAGIDSLLLWMTAMIFLAFIPLVGMSVIYIPTCIYLFFTDKIFESIALFIWCTLISLIVENWFKPKFVGDRVKIHSTIVFLSIIGGMNVFGVTGIFYGPLIVSIFLTFVSLYHKRYTNSQSS
ncbi:MAG: AI-2E family transporter [Proteobacteria bacterium]|nr:AI-2E family transporter [Pseudomonadota bacterium]